MKRSVIITILIAFIAGALGAYVFVPNSASVAQKESAYDRVMRTGTVRCGYVPINPVVIKDPNTGKLSGMDVEIVEAMGKLLNLKVEWTQEMTFATTAEDLKNNKYDLVCVGGYYIPSYRRYTEVTDPIKYVKLMAYVRADDHRFDKDLKFINDPAVTIGAVDATVPMLIAPEDYPKAKISSLPAGTPYSDNLLMVETKKADVTFVEESVGRDYLKNHPGSLRPLESAGPVRVYPAGFYLKGDEQQWLNALNMTITYMRANGQLQAILNKYNKDGRVFYSDMNEARN